MSHNTDKGKLVSILAGMDYEGGGMMRWHPSGTPTEQAFTVAESIQKEGFIRPGAPITEEEFTDLVLEHFHSPDSNHPSWWLNPYEMMRAFTEKFDITRKI